MNVDLYVVNDMLGIEVVVLQIRAVELYQQMQHQMQQVLDIEVAGHIIQQPENVHIHVILDILG